MAEDRFALKRRLERRARWRRRIRWGLLVLVAGVLVWLIAFSSVLGAASVQVTGLTTLDASEVEQRAAIRPGEPLARLDTSAAERRVEELTRVASVSVQRRWPRTVRIVVRERQAVAWIRSGSGFRGIDREGVDFRAYEKKPADLVELQVPSSGEARRDAIESAAAVVDTLRRDDPDLLERVRSVSARSGDSVELTLGGDRVVRWGNAKESTAKLRVLRVLLQSVKARQYDVSAPEQPTTRR